MINQFETYGKINPLKKLVMDITSAFKTNPMTERLVRSLGMKSYVPKRKNKFYIATATSVILASPIVPGGVVAVYPLMKWGLK